MVRPALWLGILSCVLAAKVEGQGSGEKYILGIRSALILGAMDLSKVDPAFDDLDFDGIAGPHISGVFFLYRVRPHLRIGFETLVASSNPEEVTTMNYQAAGPVAELSYGESWSIAAGVHVGGLIANVMARQGAAPSQGASSGYHYKGDGGFFAPYAGLGRHFNRNELRIFVKPVVTFGESSRGGLSGFAAWFGGIGYGRRL